MKKRTTKKKTTKMYQFNGVRTCTEFLTVELECESLEEAQSIIDSGDFEDKIVSSSISKVTDLEYVGIENYVSMDDPRFLFDTEDMINDMFSKE
jgi:hypothetical protein